MNYIAEINSFERALETVRLSGNAQLLWYKLMCLANRSNWAEWIEVDNGRLASMLGCGNKTLISARDKLIEKCFIEYQRGKGHGVGKYKVLSLMCKNDTSTYTSVDTSTYTSSNTSGVKKEKKQKKEINNNNIINKNRNKNDRTATVMNTYTDNIGSVTPAILQKMEMWLDAVDESLIIYAIEQAALNNKANWAYIDAIISNHYKAGRKTRAEAESVKRKGDKKPDSKYDFVEIERQAFRNINKGELINAD